MNKREALIILGKLDENTKDALYELDLISQTCIGTYDKDNKLCGLGECPCPILCRDIIKALIEEKK